MKLFHKIASVALGMSLALGIGVVASRVGSGAIKEAKAATGSIEITVSDYATAHSWNSGTKYTSMTMDTRISATMSSSTYTGTYNSDGWKIYETDSGTLTITANDATLTYITITWKNAKNNGCLKKGGSTFASATRTAVTGTSAVFNAGHSSGNSVGQVGISKIKVEYTYTSSSTFAVSYNANGGTGNMNGSTEPEGSFTLPACTFTNANKVFIGWKAGNAGSMIAAGGTYNLTAATEFYAQWADASSQSDPYTVAEANAIAEAMGTTATLANAYVKGIIYKNDGLSSGAITYWISDDGTNSNGFEIYKGKGLNGASFASKDDLLVEDEVIVKGTLKKFNTTYELDQNNQLISRKTITSIAVKTAPTKVEYDADDLFDPTGLVITATYTTTTSGGSSTTTKDVAYSGNQGDFSFNPALDEALTKSDNSVAITYKGKIANQSITVNAVPVVNSVTLNKAESSININGTDTLTATIDADVGAEYSVTWTSSKPAVASISGDGLTRTITGLKRGTSTITVTAGAQSAECVVTVNDPNAITFTRSDFGENESQIAINGSKNNVSFAVSNGALETGIVKVYKNQTVTITCDNHNISMIEFTCTASNTTKGGPGCFGSLQGYSYSGTIGTWEGDTDSVVFTASGEQVYISQVVIVLNSQTLTPALAVSSVNISARVGKTTQVTLTPSHFGGDTIAYTNDTNACATLSYTNNTLNVRGDAIGSHTFTITATSTTDNTKHASVQINVIVEASLGTLARVTSNSGLTSGDTYVMGTANDTYKVLMGDINDKNVRSTVDATSAINAGLTEVDGDEMNNDVVLITLLPASEGKFYIYDINNSVFLVGSDSSGNLTNTSTLASASEWTISISDNVLSIVLSTRQIMYNYNGGTDRFGCYDPSTFASGIKPVLYKVSGSSLKTRLNNFCADTMKMSSYVGDTSYDQDRCEANYAAAKVAFNGLSVAERLLFVTHADYADAKARLVWWATANGDSLDENNSLSANARINALYVNYENDSAAVMVVTIVSIVSLVTVGAYFLLKKKHA